MLRLLLSFSFDILSKIGVRVVLATGRLDTTKPNALLEGGVVRTISSQEVDQGSLESPELLVCLLDGSDLLVVPDNLYLVVVDGSLLAVHDSDSLEHDKPDSSCYILVAKTLLIARTPELVGPVLSIGAMFGHPDQSLDGIVETMEVDSVQFVVNLEPEQEKRPNNHDYSQSEVDVLV